jgi:hypothetical protein
MKKETLMMLLHLLFTNYLFTCIVLEGGKIVKMSFRGIIKKKICCIINFRNIGGDWLVAKLMDYLEKVMIINK